MTESGRNRSRTAGTISYSVKRKKDKILTTFSILCPSPVMESASSRPDAKLIKDENSGVFGRERTKIPKAAKVQFKIGVAR